MGNLKEAKPCSVGALRLRLLVLRRLMRPSGGSPHSGEESPCSPLRRRWAQEKASGRGSLEGGEQPGRCAIWRCSGGRSEGGGAGFFTTTVASCGRSISSYVNGRCASLRGDRAQDQRAATASESPDSPLRTEMAFGRGGSCCARGCRGGRWCRKRALVIGGRPPRRLARPPDVAQADLGRRPKSPGNADGRLEYPSPGHSGMMRPL